MTGHTTRLHLLLASVLCGVVFSVTGLAQDARPATQPTFRAEVSLVEVVAVVTGEDDRSLEDLAASDFEVLEDGTARTLVSVRKLSAESRQAAVVGASAGAAEAYVERLPTSTASADAPAFVLLLDDLDTSPRDSHRVIKTGERALSYVPDSALLSVVTTSGIGGSLLTLQPPSPLHIKQVRDFRGQLLLRPRLMSGTAPHRRPSQAPWCARVGSARLCRRTSCRGRASVDGGRQPAAPHTPRKCPPRAVAPDRAGRAPLRHGQERRRLCDRAGRGHGGACRRAPRRCSGDVRR